MLRIFVVPLIMGCALAGTVGMLKAIEKISPEQFERHESTKKE